MKYSLTENGLTLTLEIFPIGEDICAALYGGAAHIGSTAVALPRLSLTGSGERSCTSSVINVTGHKDEALVRRCAETLCRASGHACTCTGGFHLDHITAEQIGTVGRLLDRLLESAAKDIGERFHPAAESGEQ